MNLVVISINRTLPHCSPCSSLCGPVRSASSFRPVACSISMLLIIARALADHTRTAADKQLKLHGSQCRQHMLQRINGHPPAKQHGHAVVRMGCPITMHASLYHMGNQQCALLVLLSECVPTDSMPYTDNKQPQ